MPLDPQLLGEKAMQCRAYAKALHYKEEEFHKGPTSQVLEALISINNKLQQREAAMGKISCNIGAVIAYFFLLYFIFVCLLKNIYIYYKNWTNNQNKS